MMSISAVLQKLWFGLFPPVCLICRQPAQHSMDICTGCQADLPALGYACQRCAEPLGTQLELCGRCQQRLPAYDRVHAAFLYHPPVSRLVSRFKYQRHQPSGQALGQLLALSVQQAIAAQSIEMPDCLLPIPLHPMRQIQRRFNQSAMLAADVQSHLQRHNLHTKVDYQVLQRTRLTKTQTGLSLTERRRNLKAAFRLSAAPPKHVALVDDVLTSGSTAAECASLLKHNGCERVQVWVVARAQRPD